MTRSYKMLVVLAMVAEGAFPGEITIERLAQRVRVLARRSAVLRADVGDVLDDDAGLITPLEAQPIAARTEGRGTGGTAFFRYANRALATALGVPDDLRDAAADLAGELAEWRLARYIERQPREHGADRIGCRVSHAGDATDRFRWQSQNRTARDSRVGQMLAQAETPPAAVHLFVRAVAKRGGKTEPFTYCGTLAFERWEGDRPITVWWRLVHGVPASLRAHLRVPGPERGE